MMSLSSSGDVKRTPPWAGSWVIVALGASDLALVGLHHVTDEPAGLLGVADPERADPLLDQRAQRALVHASGQVALTELDLEAQLGDLGGRALAPGLLVLGHGLLELLAVGADDVEDEGVVHRAGEALGRPPLGDLR